MLANPELLRQAVELEAETGEGMVRILALSVRDMMDTEYYPMHREAAVKALRIFALGSKLHTAGIGSETTHFDLIRQRAVIFLVGPQAHMNRLGPLYSLHISCFLDALYRGAGPLTLLNDEFTNTPLRAFVEALTTIRAYGGEVHNIAQSRTEIERKFGKLEAETIDENAIVKQWFGFSSMAEAKRASEAMGEMLALQASCLLYTSPSPRD